MAGVAYGKELYVFCSACEHTHALLMSRAVKTGRQLSVPITDYETGVLLAMRPDMNISKRIVESHASEIEPVVEVSYQCPVNDKLQIVLVTPEDISQSEEIEILSILDKHVEPWWPDLPIIESHAPIALSQEVSAFVNKRQTIYLSSGTPKIPVLEPDQKVKYVVIEAPSKGTISVSENTEYDLSNPILYDSSVADYDSFTFAVYFENRPELYNIGTVTILVNNTRSIFPGFKYQGLIEYSKELIPNSVNKLKEFVNFIVPTVTGVITVHIGLFSFFGLEKIHQLDITKTIFYISPIFPMIVSLFLFHYAILPSLHYIQMGNIRNTNIIRASVLAHMRTWILIGFAIFSGSLVLMGLVLIPVFQEEKEQPVENFVLYKNPKFNYQVQYLEFWNVSVHDNNGVVIFNQLGDIGAPSIKITAIKMDEKPELREYALEVKTEIGENASTPFPGKLGQLSAYTMKWTNNSYSKFIVVALQDNTNTGFIFEYSTRTVDYDLYQSTMIRMKDSITFS